MSSRIDDKYRGERSRSRSRPYRDGHRDHSRDRFERERRDVKGKERSDEDRRGRSRSRSMSPTRRKSHSPRRRSRPRSRSRSPDASREKRREHSRDKRRRSRSRSRSPRSSSSDSSSDRRHHRKRDKHHKRKRSRSRDRKERKKEKKDKKKKKALASSISHQWGKYGIITETDLYNKEPEFRAWLVEERMINPETIGKDQTRKEFAKFMEDYNTATLPHEKFYNIASYETRMDAMRSGEFVPPADDTYDPNADLRVLQGKQRDKRKARDAAETYMSREQLLELRKVQAERIEAGKMKLLGMDIKQTMGVRMDGTMFDD